MSKWGVCVVCEKDIDDQYVKLEDYNKLLELAEEMLDDLIHEGMHVDEYIDEMKLIKGDLL
tara:strand:- start:457 stop:639 length:183 start_codon:yes stop_codon:yes gene_type:complete